MRGILSHWQELSSVKVLTTGNEQVLYLQRLSVNSETLEEGFELANIGKNTSSSQKNDKLIGLSYLREGTGDFIVGLSGGGCLYRMKREGNEESCVSLTTQKTIGYICRYCLAQFLGKIDLDRHIGRLHIGPVVCPMCSNTMQDVAELNAHKINCFL